MESTAYKVNDKLNAPAEEAYKVLRTNIQFCNFSKGIKTIAITSCNPKEGKTTTAINLAVSMAKSGMRVLLIDADLRKPMLLKHLGGKNEAGLSNYISGYSTLEEVTNSTDVDNLNFITCGPKPPNPAELIGSNRFSDILKEAQKKYDMIIIDTPPLGSVIDCAIISAQTDGTLIVIETKAIDYQNALRVKDQLERANARILGVVLNKVSKGDYKNYYNYYNYYGKARKFDIGKLKKLMSRKV